MAGELQITQEWRVSISKRLDKQDDHLESIRNAITQLMLNSSTNTALGELEKRVRLLENFQIRVLTVSAATQLAIAVAWAIFTKLYK